MKTIMARSPHEGSFSFSRRFLNWRIIKKVDEDEEDNDLQVLTTTTTTSYHSFSGTTTTSTIPPPLPKEEAENFHHKHSSSFSYSSSNTPPLNCFIPNKPRIKNKKSPSSSSKLRSALSLFTHKPRPTTTRPSLASKVVGTLFGYRRGQVHIAFQATPDSPPSFLIQISTPTSILVREMASGLVRVALECDKKPTPLKPKLKLLDEPLWRAYCNGKKCGYATSRRESSWEEEEAGRILGSVGPVTMGAGVLPAGAGAGAGARDDDEVGPEGELMYMRARFERVVGSKDSEAFYMMNPDGNGGPELSVYLLRV